jgi:sulfatase maturation enzyme AslB (radical SAM superfamily)
MVSVDGLGDRHDELRRMPGLFDRLEAGLSRTRRDYPAVSVVLNTVLSRLNLDQIEAIAGFGLRHGTRVSFQAMDETDYGYGTRKPYLSSVQLDADEAANADRRIADLRRQGFPVTDSNAYLARLGPDAASWSCHFKKVCLRVEPNGDVLDCTGDGLALCNTRECSLDEFTRGSRFSDFLARAEQCNRCRDYAVVEISHLWEGKVEALWNAVRTLS